MNLLASFKVPVTFHLSPDQRSEALRALNTYHLGDPECNRLDEITGLLVPKYPDKETQEFRDSIHSVSMDQTVYITVGLGYDGRLSIIQ